MAKISDTALEPKKHKKDIDFLKEEEGRTRGPRERITRPYTLIVLPAIITTIGFLIPFLWGIVLSFTKYKLNNPVYKFNFGLNYWNLLKSPEFWFTTFRTFEYAILAVGIELLLGFFIAMLLNTETVMAKISRRLIALPLMVAPAVGTVLLKLMLNNQFGVINYLMTPFGLRNFPWGASMGASLFTVVLVDVWIYTPFMVLIILAGLRSLPKDPFEAAAVDGARFGSTLRNITIPMILPAVFIAIIFRAIDSIKVFDIIWGMTAGGPGTSTMVYSVNGFIYVFGSLDVAKGTALMVITWIIVYLISQQLVKYWSVARSRLSRE